jgi:hypothetical protein
MTIHIVLDTNFIFRKNLWEPAEMSTILGTAKQIGAKVWLPEGVKEEWRSSLELRIRGAYEKYKTAKSDLKSVMIEVSKDSFEISKDLYRLIEENEKFIKENEIDSIPHPKNIPELAEFFSLAVAKKAPFDNEGNSFRDAIIVLAIEELAEVHKQDEFFLLSGDKSLRNGNRFRLGNIKTLTAALLTKELEKHLNETQKKKQLELGKVIHKFIIDHRKPALKAQQVIEYLSFEPTSIGAISLAGTPTKGEESVVFLTEVTGDLTYVTKPTGISAYSIIGPKRVNRIGEVRAESAYDDLDEAIAAIGQTEIKVEKATLVVFGAGLFSEKVLKDVVLNTAKERSIPSDIFNMSKSTLS